MVYTNVYDTPNGNLQGTVAWTQDPSKSFKELKQGTAIAWGSNTDALESAQCMGVYLKVDDALADVKKLGVATAKSNWNPQIKSVLSNGQDWDSGGVSKLASKIDNMPDANWLEMLFLAKGMKNFILLQLQIIPLQKFIFLNLMMKTANLNYLEKDKKK